MSADLAVLVTIRAVFAQEMTIAAGLAAGERLALSAGVANACRRHGDLPFLIRQLHRRIHCASQGASMDMDTKSSPRFFCRRRTACCSVAKGTPPSSSPGRSAGETPTGQPTGRRRSACSLRLQCGKDASSSFNEYQLERSVMNSGPLSLLIDAPIRRIEHAAFRVRK